MCEHNGGAVRDLDAVHSRVQQVTELGEDKRFHQQLATLPVLGHVAEQSHHIAQQL